MPTRGVSVWMLVEVGVMWEWGTDAWGLSIVGELQDVDHIFALLLEDVFPGVIWHVLQSLAHGIVVVSARPSTNHYCEEHTPTYFQRTPSRIGFVLGSGSS